MKTDKVHSLLISMVCSVMIGSPAISSLNIENILSMCRTQLSMAGMISGAPNSLSASIENSLNEQYSQAVGQWGGSKVASGDAPAAPVIKRVAYIAGNGDRQMLEDLKARAMKSETGELRGWLIRKLEIMDKPVTLQSSFIIGPGEAEKVSREFHYCKQCGEPTVVLMKAEGPVIYVYRLNSDWKLVKAFRREIFMEAGTRKMKIKEEKDLTSDPEGDAGLANELIEWRQWYNQQVLKIAQAQ